MIMNKPRIFDEIGILKKNKKMFSKLENKGTSCMFVGYSENHPADTYRLYVLDTKKVVIARDVQWLDTTINQNRKIRIDNRGVDTSKWIEEEIDLDDAKVDEKIVRFATSQDLTKENNEKEKKLLETNRTIYADNEEDNRNTVENENEIESSPRHEFENQDKAQEENQVHEDETGREVSLQEIKKKRDKIRRVLKKIDVMYESESKMKREL